MAILDNRIGTASLTSSLGNIMSQAKDSVLKAGLATLNSVTSSSGFNLSSLTGQIKSNVNSRKSTMGMFGDVICDNTDPLAIRLPKYNATLDRELNSGTNYDLCPNTKTKSPLDNAIGQVFKLDIPNLGLSVDKTSLVDSLIGTVSKKSLSTLGISGTVPDCLLSSVKDKLGSGISTTGFSLSNKLDITNLFSGLGDSCFATAVLQPGVSTAITNITTSSMLDNLSKMGTGSMAAYAESIVNGKTDITKDNLLAGLSMSLGTPGTGSTVEKLDLLTVMKNTTSVTDNLKETLVVKTDGELVLQNIGTELTTTKSPTSLFNTITTGMDNVDSSWDKDADGNTSYYKANNPMLGTLVTGVMESKTPTVNTGTTTTTMSPELGISILSKFGQQSYA